MARKAQGGAVAVLRDGQRAQGAALLDVILDGEVTAVHFHAFAALADEHAWGIGAVAQQQAAGAAQATLSFSWCSVYCMTINSCENRPPAWWRGAGRRCINK